MARRMEHPIRLHRTSGTLGESSVCAANPNEGENYLLLKERGFSFHEERWVGSSPWVS